MTVLRNNRSGLRDHDLRLPSIPTLAAGIVRPLCLSRFSPLYLGILLLTLPVNTTALSATRVELPSLTRPGQAGWQEKSFAGRTAYKVVWENGKEMLQASSHGTASGLFLSKKIDLRRTPVLNWSWKVTTVMQGMNERQKAGDDFPARVYVVARGGLAFWKTRALSYVWSNNQAAGTFWPSPFTANAVLIAAQGGRQRLGQLMEEKHNVRQDWQRAFAEDIAGIDAIAIMTDSDNSGQSASGLYSTPWFSEE